MQKRAFLILSAWLFFLQSCLSYEGNYVAKPVAVIAPSVSTSMKAREIISRMHWIAVPPDRTDMVLVVVRSLLAYPLFPSYGSFQELERAAEMQVNISGPNYHAYLFRLNTDGSYSQFEHTSFPANEY